MGNIGLRRTAVNGVNQLGRGGIERLIGPPIVGTREDFRRSKLGAMRVSTPRNTWPG